MSTFFCLGSSYPLHLSDLPGTHMACWQPFSGSPIIPGPAYLSSLIISPSFSLLGSSYSDYWLVSGGCCPSCLCTSVCAIYRPLNSSLPFVHSFPFHPMRSRFSSLSLLLAPSLIFQVAGTYSTDRVAIALWPWLYKSFWWSLSLP